MDQQLYLTSSDEAQNKQLALKAIAIYCLVFIGGLVAVSYTHLTLPTTPYV